MKNAERREDEKAPKLKKDGDVKASAGHAAHQKVSAECCIAQGSTVDVAFTTVATVWQQFAGTESKRTEEMCKNCFEKLLSFSY